MARVDHYRGKGYYMSVVRVGVDEYAIAISKPYGENRVFVDLKHLAEYTWTSGNAFFRDCRTHSQKTAHETMERLRVGFKVREEDPNKFSLNRPDAVIVEDPVHGYAIKVSEGIWWLPKSKPRYLALHSLDFSNTVKESDDDFIARAFTKNKKFILALHEACLRTGKAPKGGFKEVSAEDLRSDDDI